MSAYLKRLALLLGASLLCANAGASGDNSPYYTQFRSVTRPDLGAHRFQAGELGVLQAGMDPVYAHAAWRAIMLGAAGLKHAPGPADGLERADASLWNRGWRTSTTGRAHALQWLAAQEAALGRKLPDQAIAESGFFDCPATSYQLATQTLTASAKRKDASAQRLQDWITAQRQVFQSCGDSPAKPADPQTRRQAQVPAPLPASEAAYWRALRLYQIAAVLFHKEEHVASAAAFALVASDRESPLRAWGAYLNLRAQVRAGAKAGVTLAGVYHDAQRLLADPSMAERHADTRALLRTAQAVLQPAERLAELSALLADPAQDPYRDDQLSDWAYLLRGDGTALRKSYALVDWTATLGSCAAMDNPDKTCSAEARHALALWQASSGAAARTWAVAALMLADSLPPALEKAALAVAPSAPEYLTVRYHLARLYRQAGRLGEARSLADAVLAGAPASPTARNLFHEERFATATSFADAAPHAMREPIASNDFDSAERRVVSGAAAFNIDAMRWLGQGVRIEDLISVARETRLAPALRTRVAAAAWMRADLLDQSALAQQALGVLAQLEPGLQDQVRPYAKAANALERRHLMLKAALRFQLTPTFSEWQDKVARTPDSEALASNWCKFTPSPDQDAWPTRLTWRMPPVLVPQNSQASKELASLERLKSATGYIGEHTLHYAKLHPQDPDLPWMLHVVVKSTKGGCLDDGAKKLSLAAYQLLHTRYRSSPWSAKTPYFY